MHSPSITLSRRHLLGSCAAGAAGFALSACGGGGADTDDALHMAADGAERDTAQATVADTFTAYWNALMGSTSAGGAILKCGATVNNVQTEAYILDPQGNSGGPAVKSEGQSYGLMLAVLNNQPTMFKRLWTWTKNHMLHGSAEYKGRLAWLCKAEFTAGWKGIQNQSAPRWRDLDGHRIAHGRQKMGDYRVHHRRQRHVRCDAGRPHQQPRW
jgi:Glycosyl hydrolases family 8